MDTLMSDYLTHLAKTPNARGKLASAATIRAASADLRGFLRWWADGGRGTVNITLVMDTDLLAYQRDRQQLDGASISTINRASASLRSFFAWCHTEGHIAHNPAARLRDLPLPDTAPQSVPSEAIDLLFRCASTHADPVTRLRDLALLTLLFDCGVRSQEAADVQARDLDLAGAMLTVRAGKNGNHRRVPLTDIAVRRLREYARVRFPDGWPALASAAEREPVLAAQAMAKPGRPWLPGMQTSAMRKRLIDLRALAAERVREHIKKEPNLERVGELEAVLRALTTASPHALRHGLAYQLHEDGNSPAYIQKILGHRRIATSLQYGKPTEQDLRHAMETAGQTARTRKRRDPR